MPTFGTQPAVAEYVFRVRWWKRFVLNMLEHDEQLVRMEARTSRNHPLPITELMGWHCSSWRSSFEVREAVRTMSHAISRGRVLHGDNMAAMREETSRNHAHVSDHVHKVHLELKQVEEHVRMMGDNLETESGELQCLQSAHHSLVDRLEQREQSLADLVSRVVEIEAVNRQQQLELT